MSDPTGEQSLYVVPDTTSLPKQRETRTAEVCHIYVKIL